MRATTFAVAVAVAIATAIVTVVGAKSSTPRYRNLVLEGGGLRGVSYVGAAQAFSDTGYYLDRRYAFENISGASIGCLFGYAIALDVEPNDLERVLISTNLADLFEPRVHELMDFPRYRDSSIDADADADADANDGGDDDDDDDAANDESSFVVRVFRRVRYLYRLIAYAAKSKILWSNEASPGLSTGRDLMTWLANNVSRLSPYRDRLDADATMADLRRVTGRELTCFATSLGKPYVTRFNARLTPDARLMDAIYASMTVPFVLKPLRDARGRPLVDGGLVNNFPIYEYDATEESARVTLGLSLHGENGLQDNDDDYYPRTIDDAFDARRSRFCRIRDHVYLQRLIDVVVNVRSYVQYATDPRNCDRVVFLDSQLRWFDFDVSTDALRREIARARVKTRDHLLNRIGVGVDGNADGDGESASTACRLRLRRRRRQRRSIDDYDYDDDDYYDASDDSSSSSSSSSSWLLGGMFRGDRRRR